MMYKNTLKLLVSNFHLVWKIFAHLFITTLVLIGLAYAGSLPIINVLNSNGVSRQFADIFVNFSKSFNFYELLHGFVKFVENFFEVISANISNLWMYIVLLLFILIVLRAFLNGFYKLAATNVLYYHLSSNIKIGFTASLFSSFKSNLKYQFAYLFIGLPLDIAFFSTLYYALRWLVMSNGFLIIAPILLMFVIIFLLSAKITLFSGWLPAMVVFDVGPIKGFAKGIKAVFRRFYRSFSTAVAMVTTLIVINIVCAFATFGASLLITVPITLLANLTYNMTMFYLSQGMRFYVDNENVVTPKLLEETDSFKKLKYII